MIVAGEASGDMHAAGLVNEVRSLDSEVRFFGIGGVRMRKAGVEILVDSASLAVVGIIEVLKHWSEISGALKRMRGILRNEPPDLLILTDYPDFNLRLARTATECGVKVLYYISPQVWAWRQSRVKVIRERVDMMAVVFPFEEQFYQRHGVPVRFVGHPLRDEVQPSQSAAELRAEFGLDPDNTVVGLFPGSRHSEIRRLMPVILGAAQILHRSRPALQFLLPVASTLREEDFAPWLHDHDVPVRLVPDRAREVIEACDAIITASGTVTLEIALLGTPMVVVYKVAPLTYFLVKRLIKIEHLALCNIVAGEQIVPELIQSNATPQRIAGQISAILDDPQRARTMREQLLAVREQLGVASDSDSVGRLVIEMLADN
ncbi:MAG: lipid-A-disaccharide synthase [Pseudomonadota bacterium]|nr:MAG: lipid-A-disaccharide synthase [Pseudomonadota bacterium]